jgi:hypothetical protein
VSHWLGPWQGPSLRTSRWSGGRRDGGIAAAGAAADLVRPANVRDPPSSRLLHLAGGGLVHHDLAALATELASRAGLGGLSRLARA